MGGQGLTGGVSGEGGGGIGTNGGGGVSWERRESDGAGWGVLARSKWVSTEPELGKLLPCDTLGVYYITS